MGDQVSDLLAAQHDALKPFFEHLAVEGVGYCILHPFAERGFGSSTDVDVFVPEAALGRADRYLIDHGWRRANSFRFPALRKHYYKVVGLAKVKLDLSAVVGVYTASGCAEYTNAVTRVLGPDGFYYLDDLAGYCLIAKKGLDQGFVRPSKQAELATLVARNDRVAALVAAPTAAGVMPSVAVHQFFRPVNRRALGIRALLGAYRARARPATARIILSFVGLDGAGKGTYLSMLREQLVASQLHVRVCYLGHSGYRLRAVRRIAAVRAVMPGGVLRSAISVLYYALLPLDMLTRRGRGTYDVLLTDRHPLYEPVFTRRERHWYDRLLVAVCPRPSAVIYLTGDPAVIWQRKQEHSYEAYSRKHLALEHRVSAYASEVPTITIDTSDGIPSTFRRLRQAVAARV